MDSSLPTCRSNGAHSPLVLDHHVLLLLAAAMYDKRTFTVAEFSKLVETAFNLDATSGNDSHIQPTGSRTFDTSFTLDSPDISFESQTDPDSSFHKSERDMQHDASKLRKLRQKLSFPKLKSMLSSQKNATNSYHVSPPHSTATRSTPKLGDIPRIPLVSLSPDAALRDNSDESFVAGTSSIQRSAAPEIPSRLRRDREIRNSDRTSSSGYRRHSFIDLETSSQSTDFLSSLRPMLSSSPSSPASNKADVASQVTDSPMSLSRFPDPPPSHLPSPPTTPPLLLRKLDLSAPTSYRCPPDPHIHSQSPGGPSTEPVRSLKSPPHLNVRSTHRRTGSPFPLICDTHPLKPFPSPDALLTDGVCRQPAPLTPSTPSLPWVSRQQNLLSTSTSGNSSAKLDSHPFSDPSHAFVPPFLPSEKSQPPAFARTRSDENIGMRALSLRERFSRRASSLSSSAWWIEDDDEQKVRQDGLSSSPSMSDAGESISDFMPGRFSAYVKDFAARSKAHSNDSSAEVEPSTAEEETEHQCFQAAMDLRLQMSDYHSGEPVFGGIPSTKGERLRLSVLVEEENVKGPEDDDDIYYTPRTSLHDSICL